MTYSEWSKKVIVANRLQDIVEAFARSDEKVWYIDRHVLDVGEEDPQLEDAGRVESACRVALPLFRDWDAVAAQDREDAVLVARPILVVDDDWLQDNVSAPPPHVMTTLARHTRYLGPHVLRCDDAQLPLCLSDLTIGSGLSSANYLTEDNAEADGAWFIWNTNVGTE